MQRLFRDILTIECQKAPHWQNGLESGKDPNANCLTILFPSLPNPTPNGAKKFNKEGQEIRGKSHSLASGLLRSTRDKPNGQQKIHLKLQPNPSGLNTDMF